MPIEKTKSRTGYLLSVVVLALGSFFLFMRFGESTRTTPLANDSPWPTRQELRSKLRTIRKEMLVYGTGQKDAADSYRLFAEQYTKEMRWLQVLVKPDTAVTTAEIDSLPIWVIGTPSSNALLRRIKDALPVKIEKEEFSLASTVFSEPNDVYSLSLYPNPLQRDLPVSILSGNSDSAVVDILKRYSRNFRSGDLQVFRDGQAVAYGFFKQDGSGPWKIDPDQTRNYLNTSHDALETEHYRFTFHGKQIPREKMQALAEKQQRQIETLFSRLALPAKSFPKISYHLYDSFEDKGLMTRNTDLSHPDFEKWQVHAVFNEDVNGADFYADALLIFKKYLGECESPALVVGAAMLFSEDWGRDGFRYWAKRFYDTDNLIALSDLLTPEIFNRESYLFMRPLAASFAEFLTAKYGWKTFQGLYLRWPKSGLPTADLEEFTMAELESGWRQHLREIPAVTVHVHDKTPQPVFQKGFCYAHEGYQIYNGYLSRKSFESLKKLRALGTDWVSLTPFGYLEDRNQPSPFHYSFGAGAESDESLVAAAIFAHQLGMKVMLKPHVLMSGGDWGWPGEIDMKSEENWQRFFAYYYSWIRHYALLAEIYHFDLFCIGVEFMHATPNHDAEWRRMISKIRQLYHGPLVYAANWYQEFEGITFWDALDYIGLNLYYPLSQKQTATLEDLRKGMSTGMPVIERIVQKYHKPLLLTEVGFTSTAAPWKSPHERNRQAPLSLQDQALCYQAIFESFKDKEWFFGFYWWKWPTYLEHGGPASNDFTPNGKPAEQVAREWYSREWR